jgi:hypothetical protein
MQSDSDNPYSAPQSGPQLGEPAAPQPQLGSLLRLLFAACAIGGVVFECRYAFTHSVSWRDLGHWVAAIGATCQFTYMAYTGFWTASSRRNDHAA